MGDRDGELILKQLQSDNQKLAEQLSQSYIPPKDPVVGTTWTLPTVRIVTKT